MFRHIELNLHPDERTLRRFGWAALVVFGGLAAAAFTGRALFSHAPVSARLPLAVGLALLAGLSGALSLVRPRANRPLYVVLSVVSFPLGLLLSYVSMALLFFVVFGFVGVVWRCFRHDPLGRMTATGRSSLDSYWSARRERRDPDRYFRQF